MRDKMRLKTESQILYQKIFEQSSDAIAIANEDFEIQKANPAFSEMTGTGAISGKGKKLSLLSPKKKTHTTERLRSSTIDARSSATKSSASKGRSKT